MRKKRKLQSARAATSDEPASAPDEPASAPDEPPSTTSEASAAASEPPPAATELLPAVSVDPKEPAPTAAAAEPLPAVSVDPEEPPSTVSGAEPLPVVPDAAEEATSAAEEPTPMAEDAIAPAGAQSPPTEPNGSAEPASEPNSNPESDLEPEPIRDLVEPLAKDQLVDLLLRAASRHPDVVEEIREIVGIDPAHRKVFVHGLGWDTSTETLLSVFSPFGEIEDCNAVQDKATGKSKGYGFVLFKHRDGARKALKEPQKRIGSRMAACQLASLGSVPTLQLPQQPASEYTQRKIYVSNVGADIDPQKLTEFFAKFGEIEEGPLGLDKQTGKPKGFCLFIYKAAEGIKKALEEPHKNFEGHVLHCQKAIDGFKAQKGGWIQQGTWGGQQLASGYQGSSHLAKSVVSYGSGAVGRGMSLGTGHLMAPSQAALGYNHSAHQASAVINPALGQALTALLTTPNAGIGLTNLLGSLGSSGQVAGQGVPRQGGYVNQGAGLGGIYGGQSYGAGRPYGGGPPYMGR